MIGGISIEESLEQMSKRLERAEQANRAMKIWGSIALAALIAFGSGPFASSVLAKKKPPALLQAERIELVTSSGQVLAALGTDSDGTGLTVLDSSGKKTLTLGNSADETFAGMATWDGNSIFPGTGAYRSSFGESNAKNVSGGGFGFAVWDSAEKARVVAGTTPDVMQGYFETIDPNGSAAGITDDDKTFHQQGFFANDLNGKNRTFVGNSLDGTTFNTIQTADPNGSVAGISDNSGLSLQGFFANDLNGKNRVFAGNSLDGTTFEQISFNDSKGNFAGLLGFNASLGGSVALGSSLVLADPSGTFFAGENLDGAGVDWGLIDTNGVERAFGDFDGTTESVDLFSPADVLVGHLP
jgi:hypothetical protein